MLPREVAKSRTSQQVWNAIANDGSLHLAQLERQQEELTAFTALSEARGTVSKAEYDQKLKAAGFSSIPDLEDYLKKLEKSLTRARNRELGIDDSENKVRAPFVLLIRRGRNLTPAAHARYRKRPRFRSSTYRITN